MFKNMKIGKKLITAFVIVALLASIGGVVGLVVLSNLDSGYSAALLENGFVQGDIGNFNSYLNKGGAVARDIILLTDAADIKNAQEELKQASVDCDAALTKAKVNCKSPDELALIKVIDDNLALYRPLRDEAIALGLQNKNEEAMKIFHETARPYLTAAVSAGQQLMALNVSVGETVSNSLTLQGQVGMITIIATISVCLIAAVIFAIYISRGISRPVLQVQKVAQEMSKGNYDTNLDYQSKDEIGDLANNMRTMMSVTKVILKDASRALEEIARGNFDVNPKEDFVGIFGNIKESIHTIITSLSETLGQINQSSDQVSSGSDQVSSGAQALSQGATEQASSVEELAATINEISQQIKNNAGNAAEASGLVNNVSSEIMNSNQQMQEMIGAMSEISTSSKEISKVIKTIEDIAFQTNILALNAAVEAARAGAAGKGFAVVADEVRNLASKSAEAAKGTTSLIEGSIKSVENGTRIADQTAKSLLSVVEGSKDVASTVDKISVASSEQANAISQITMGIDQISSVVQTNSATAEESAAASEELSGQAQMLKSLVSRFTLKKVDNDALARVTVKVAQNIEREESSYSSARGDKY